MRRFSLILAALLALASLPAWAAADAPGRDRRGLVTASRHLPSRAAVLDYWTPARMAAARPIATTLEVPQGASPIPMDEVAEPVEVAPEEPAGPLPWRSSSGPHPYTSGEVTTAYTAYPYSTHGKVFFKDPLSGSNFVCSGTAVASENESVVWTAGHCVHGGGAAEPWMTNWMFAPAYKDGVAPLGKWTATSLYALNGWTQSADFGYDLAAALVAPNGSGESLTDVAGSRGIGWNQPDLQTYQSFGYPAASPFTGGRLRYCISGGTRDPNYVGPAPRPLAIGCDMTGGSSGGGWVDAAGTVLSVNSFGYEGLDEVMHGPYQGTAAANLYEAVRHLGAPTPSPTPTPTSTPTPTPTPSTSPSPTPSPTPTPTATPTPTPTPTPTASPTPTPTPTPEPDTRAPAMTGVAARPRTFTPNGDGTKDRTRIHFTIDENAYVTVVVVKRSGKKVKTLGRSVLTNAGSYFTTWNGKTDARRKAKAGRYKFKVKAVDEAGNRSGVAKASVKLVR